jgi:hypothetical protein
MTEQELVKQGITFKIKKVFGEYQVKVLDNGKVLDALTYYTDDRDDAVNTKAAMIEHFTL